MVGGVVVLRHEPPIQRAQQIELGNLRPRERMQPNRHARPPSRLAPPRSASWRSNRRARNAKAVLLDEPVHLVEQGRHLLHLVDDDGTTAAILVECQHPLGEQPGFARKNPERCGSRAGRSGRSPGTVRRANVDFPVLRGPHRKADCRAGRSRTSSRRYEPIRSVFLFGLTNPDYIPGWSTLPCFWPNRSNDDRPRSEHASPAGHRSQQELIEERNGEGGIPVRGAVDHPLGDQAGSAWSDRLYPDPERGGDVTGAVAAGSENGHGSEVVFLLGSQPNRTERGRSHGRACR